jgi:hypothetical protein
MGILQQASNAMGQQKITSAAFWSIGDELMAKRVSKNGTKTVAQGFNSSACGNICNESDLALTMA